MLAAGCRTNVMAAWAHSIYSMWSFLYLFKLALSAQKIIWVMAACEYEQIVIFFFSPLSYWEETESPWRPRQCHLHLYSISSPVDFPRLEILNIRAKCTSIWARHVVCTGMMWFKIYGGLMCLCWFIFTAADPTADNTMVDLEPNEHLDCN